jgi:hypothetical protein
LTAEVRIAMWSGPRNISTAMMRAWENRGDTAVWDEPLYAYYLAATGLDHPGAEEVIAAGEKDWRRVVAAILGPIPGGKSVSFQKHMTHHLLDEIDRSWLESVTHCFLIRDPREVVASYARTRGNLVIEDLGVLQQAEIFDHVRARTGTTPLVIDARDVLEDPRGIMQRLCEAVGVAFMPEMLCWPPGPRASDGVWAKHWYASVEASTGFQAYQPKQFDLTPPQQAIAEACEPYYRDMHRQRLTG